METNQRELKPRMIQAIGSNLEQMRENATKSELYLHGDMKLMWVNEGDMHALASAPAVEAPRDVVGMVAYLMDMKERKSYGSVVMANFFAHYHDTIIALAALQPSATQPDAREAFVAALKYHDDMKALFEEKKVSGILIANYWAHHSEAIRAALVLAGRNSKRDDVLEEAAKVCDEWADNETSIEPEYASKGRIFVADSLAEAIRAMKGEKA